MSTSRSPPDLGRPASDFAFFIFRFLRVITRPCDRARQQRAERHKRLGKVGGWAEVQRRAGEGTQLLVACVHSRVAEMFFEQGQMTSLNIDEVIA